MHPEHSGALGFVRANRDAMAFTTLFPSLKVGELLRRKFIDSCIKKFYEKKPVLPTYQVRKLIDVFYSRGEEPVIARIARLLSVPAELPKLLAEITGVKPNGEGFFRVLLRKVENELGPVLAKNGKVSVLRNSGFLLHGTHSDWSELRKVYDVVLHSPTLVNVEEIIRLAQKFTDTPKLFLKQLHDNKVITLLGLGKETYVWKAGTPPPKNVAYALREIHQKKLEVTALQSLQHPTLKHTANPQPSERLQETLEILKRHRIVKGEEPYQIDPHSSISLEAAINDVIPLLQLYQYI
ncbi:MAG: hypothetical protein Q6352_007345 [Candidatus Freyrarchaeum guaymaensis]|nr:hypothetical protein [Candidatus Sigynarchaeota archaeon]